jgi:hypothetical protein
VALLVTRQPTNPQTQSATPTLRVTQPYPAHVLWRCSTPPKQGTRTTTVESSSLAADDDASARRITPPRRGVCWCCAPRDAHGVCVPGAHGRQAAAWEVTMQRCVRAGRVALHAAAREAPRPRRWLCAWRLDATVCGSWAVKLILGGCQTRRGSDVIALV